MSSSEVQQTACPAITDRLVSGARRGVPILLGYLPVGMAFGVLASTAGFSPPQAIACSATALAGAGQFIALSLLASGADALSIIAGTTIVNLRYVLFAATLAPHVSALPLRWQLPVAFTLTDETFAVNITHLKDAAADGRELTACGAVAWLGWVSGTALGAFGATLAGDPSRYGADFAMAAMFTALLVAQLEDGRHAVIGMIAAACTIALMSVTSGTWYILVTPVLAATLGTVLFRDA